MLEPTTVYTPSPARYDSMTYNHVGESGLKLPAVSLGFWHNFGDITPYATMRDIVFTAFDNGITPTITAPSRAVRKRTAAVCCANISIIIATN